MAEAAGGSQSRSPNLNLSQDEQRLFTQVFSAADSDGIGVVTGDVALRFFPERTKLPSEALGEIWQIADTEDKGFLTPSGFYLVLRLIGYAQAGRAVSGDLALKGGGPLPRIEGINTGPAPPSPLEAQASGGPIKVPPLTPDKANQYAALFQQSGAQDGLLAGTTAKQIFDRSQLPNTILVQIWNLADTEQRGKLSTNEFIVAMHLLVSYRTNAMRAVPRTLPAGLWDAASRRNANQQRPISGGGPAPAIPRQFSGPATPRTSSPLAGRTAFAAPQSQMQSQSTGDWAVSPQEKLQYDGQFARLDTSGLGYVTGEQAVAFFGNSRLPEDDLAQIWDLADIKSEGQLNADEFAIAMHLIRQQLQKRGPLPTTLPSNLMPPSMRQGQAGAAASTPSQASPPKAKSAAEDLFGLDALSDQPAPSAQVPQSTGGSASMQPSRAPRSPPPTAAQPPSTLFKPFVPSSSFGQSIVAPQATGSSQQGSQPQTRDGDDLLGDTDPEVSKRLTNETTELANLSNQVGTLSNQMQDVKTKRSTTDGNLASVNTQKKEFEARLAQLRTAYEQEAREVRSLEEKLTASRNETKKVQADLAMVQHTYKSLQEQKQQLAQALEADQKENASLKERMREVNAEIAQIKPQIEKVKSDARQQKGLVAINKKQLHTNESERDRAKGELDSATRDHEQATKELEDSSRNIQSRDGTASQSATSPVGSPASQSTNPFFRRQTTGTSERQARSPLPEETTSSPNHSAFDSFFGSAYPAAGSSGEAPPVSFGTSQPGSSTDAPVTQIESKESTSEQRAPHTPSLSTSSEVTTATPLPPPPPQSRQITSSSLPFREALQRPASPSSSVGVAPPASRFGDASGYTTPTRDRQVSENAFGGSDTASAMSPSQPPHDRSSSLEDKTPVVPVAPSEGSTGPDNVPGAFPDDVSTPGPATNSRGVEEDPFAATDSSKGASSKDDFDSAFASFESKGKAPVHASNTTEDATVNRKEEFPPIQEFGDDSDSDSDSGGFDDDFAASGADRSKLSTGDTMESASRPVALRNVSNTSTLPTPSAEKSPPTYDQTVPAQPKGRSDSNQFPAEYAGLLPSRQGTEDISSPVQQTSADIGSLATNGTSEEKPLPPPPTDKAKAKDSFDDFEDDFVDLSEAQDEKADDDLGASRGPEYGDEFNPTFDSPAPSRMATSSFMGTDSFDNFEASGPAQSSIATSSSQAAAPPSDADWDAMFSGLGKEGGDGAATTNNGTGASVNDAADAVFGNAPAPAAATATTTASTAGGSSLLLSPNGADGGERPPLARAVSEGTEHDDPILKRLTAMGYARDKSLAALEKFDYNLDKAADYLTQES